MAQEDVQAMTPEQQKMFLLAVLPWKELCEKYAAIHPILKWQEISSILGNESWGDPHSTNPGDPSWGLMGVTHLIAKAFGGIKTVPNRNQEDPDTWKVKPLYGYDGTHVLYDPPTNVMCGSGFLAFLKISHASKFPVTDPNCGWPAAYNEGETNEARHVPDPAYIAAYLEKLKLLGGTPE